MMVRNTAIDIANQFLPDYKTVRIKMYSKSWYALMIPRKKVKDFLMTMVVVDQNGTPSMCSNPSEYVMRPDYMTDDSEVLHISHSYENQPGYLMHFGTPGMKWGVRNYQTKDGTWTDEGLQRRRMGGIKGSAFTKEQRYVFNGEPLYVGEKTRDRYNKKLDRYNTAVVATSAGSIAGIAVGASMAPASLPFSVASLAVLSSTQLVNHLLNKKAEREEQTGQIRKRFEKDADLTKNADSKDTKKIDGPHSMQDDVMAVNPIGYGKDFLGQLGSANNCSNCSLALEMRRRGYDVIAGPNVKGNTYEQMTAWFKQKPKVYYSVDSIDTFKQDGSLLSRKHFANMIDKITNECPQGSRFFVNLSGIYGAHTIFGTIRNGHFEMFDAQGRKKYSWGLVNTFTDVYDQSINVVRVDNLQLNWPEISKSVLVAA